MKKIITHNGAFHADDIFAVATLQLMLAHLEIGSPSQVIRTRDAEIFKTGDFVVDVGGEYDAEANRFDHHQASGAGLRADGTPYASFGLVWKKYGEQVAGSKEVADLIEKKLVEPIDTMDNGVGKSHELIADVYPYTIQDFIYGFHPTWKEGAKEMDAIFAELVQIATQILQREIIRAQHKLEAAVLVRTAYDSATDKRLLVLERRYPWFDTLLEFPEPLFVVSPDDTNPVWAVSTVRKEKHTFENRKDFPKDWGGLRDLELAKVTGVADAVFCHSKLFLVVAKSREGALKLAQLALEAN